MGTEERQTSVMLSNSDGQSNLLNEGVKHLCFSETRGRSLAKAVTYRIVSVMGTLLLTWLITRDFGKTLSITFAIQVFLIILYYASERIWNRINWGKRITSGK
jgi:uncharacterized membrane protein